MEPILINDTIALKELMSFKMNKPALLSSTNVKQMTQDKCLVSTCFLTVQVIIKSFQTTSGLENSPYHSNI